MTWNIQLQQFIYVELLKESWEKTDLDFNFNASTPYTYNINNIYIICIDVRTQLQLGTEIMTSAVSSLV